MAQVPVVGVEYVGDGVTTVFDFDFPYQKANEVFVNVDGVDTPYAFLAGSTSSIELAVAPAIASVIQIYRSTAAFAPRHVFDAGVPFLPRYVDENNRQLIFVVQEAVTTVNSVVDAVDANTAVANAAKAAADAAVLTANAAGELAVTADGNATAALLASSTALDVANGIAATANEALSTANAADVKAQTALDAVEEAGVASFNGRAGIVVSVAGDYDASQVERGAGTVEDALTAVEDTANAAVSEVEAGAGILVSRLGNVVTVAAAGSMPLLFPLWCPNRAAIPAGYVAADGQLLSRVTYPDAAAGVLAGNVPTVADASWLSTPAERGKFTSGDGSTTFRVADYNGKAVGSLGAVFLRGDGALSAAVAGAIQADALQGHNHATDSGVGGWSGSPAITDGLSAVSNVIKSTAGVYQWIKGPISDGVNGTPRTASETRPLNVTGCWIIRLFGAVVNVGSADAAQLATDLANLTARVTASEARLSTIEQGIKQSPELLWSGSIGTNGVALNLSRPLVVGDVVWLVHNDANNVSSHPLIVTDITLTAGRRLWWTFLNAFTELVLNNPSTITTANFSSGYGISRIYASKAKN